MKRLFISIILLLLCFCAYSQYSATSIDVGVLNRYVVGKPTPLVISESDLVSNINDKGYINVSITINQKGEVIKAKASAEGGIFKSLTTGASNKTLKLAKEAALSTRFNQVSSSEPPMEGFIRYYLDRFDILEKCSKFNVIIDYSEADIVGLDFNDFKAAEDEWESNEQKILSNFIKGFNNQADKGVFPHRAGRYENAECTIIIKVLKVEKRGSKVSGICLIKDSSDSIIFQKNVESEAGRFGSVSNLMGDSLYDMGEEIGRKIFR